MASEIELKKKSEIGVLASKNRHSTRSNVSKSIDFVFHTELQGPKLAADGGSFPVGEPGRREDREEEKPDSRSFLNLRFERRD